MLAIVGASGQLGFATLNALLNKKIIPPNEIVCTTSSEAGAKKLEDARLQGVHVRSAHFDDPVTFKPAFEGCERFFLISSARISKDFNNAPLGQGREKDHFGVLQIAKDVGVKHVYYTSLAFANPSKSRVMAAHERTEEWIKSNFTSYTLFREGLYNESWPLYFGHYQPAVTKRTQIVVAGDGKISWTSISDLGLANAVILGAPIQEWFQRTVYLSHSKTHTLADVAGMVSKAEGRDIALNVVSKEAYERHYVHDRDMDRAFIEWWSPTYEALQDDECEINSPILEQILARYNVGATSLESTILEMARHPKKNSE